MAVVREEAADRLQVCEWQSGPSSMCSCFILMLEQMEAVNSVAHIEHILQGRAEDLESG